VVPGEALKAKVNKSSVPWAVWKESKIKLEFILTHLKQHYDIDELQTATSIGRVMTGTRLEKPPYGLNHEFLRSIRCPNPACCRSFPSDKKISKQQVELRTLGSTAAHTLKDHAKQKKFAGCERHVLQWIQEHPGTQTHEQIGAEWAAKVFQRSKELNIRMYFAHGFIPSEAVDDSKESLSPFAIPSPPLEVVVKPPWYPRSMFALGTSIGAIRTSSESDEELESQDDTPTPALYVLSLLASPNLDRSPLRHGPKTGTMYLMQRLASAINYVAYLHLKAGSAIFEDEHLMARELVTAR